MYVSNLNGDEYPLQATIQNDYELNGNQSLTATILPTKVNKLFINKIDKLWTITDHDDVAHKIVYFKKQGTGDTVTVNIKAIPLFFDDFNGARIYEEYNEHMTAQVAFTRIFADTDFTFVLVDSFSAVNWEGFGGGETKLETFKRALNRYKAEFRIVGNVIYLHKQIGRDTQFMYRYKLNASNIQQENDATALWTYARGYGDYGDGEGGQDWQDAKLTREYTSPLAEILGKRDAPPIKNGNITTTTQMDSQLKELVDTSLKISVSATIHDLRKQGYALAQPEIGDRVFLIDERIDLNDEVRIVDISVKKDWQGNVLDLNLIFGSESITKRHQSNISTAIKNVNNWLSGKQKIPISIVDEAMKNAVNAIKSAQTELSFENGIWGTDPANPNYVTGMTSRGFMVSTDGGATAEVAITGDGIVADFITAGTLNADQVAVIGGSGDEYALIQGNEIETRGKYTRTWFGQTSVHDVGMQLKYGRLRFHNYDNSRNLYMSEFGFSTYVGGSDGEAGEDGGNQGSGTIEFFSYRHNPTIRGLTMYSNNGPVALESEQRNVVIAPYYTTRADSTRKFNFSVKTSEGNDGYTTYGNSGIRYQSSGSSVIYATNGSGNKGSGSFYGQYLYGDLKPRGTYAYAVAPRLRVVTDDTKEAYGEMQASDFIQTSSREKKENIRKFEDNATDVLSGLEVVKFDYINGDRDRIGVVAEDSPSIADEERETVSLGDTTFLHTKAIQELNDRVKELEGIINGD